MESKKFSFQQHLSYRSYQLIKERMKEKRFQAITMLILTLLALSLFGLFAIGPTITTIAELKRQLTDRKKVDEQLRTKIQNLSVLGQKYLAIQNDLTTLDNALPKNPNIPLLIGQIQSVAQDSNVVISQLQTSETPLGAQGQKQATDTVNKPTPIVFSTTIEGSLANIQTFIQNLTQFNRIVTIDEVSTNQSSAQGNQGQAQINGKAYFMP